MRRISSMLALVVSLLLGCSGKPNRLRTLELNPQLPADGRVHRLAKVASSHPEDLHAESSLSTTAHFEAEGASVATLFIRTPVRPGALAVTVSDGRQNVRFTTSLTADSMATADGTPDWMRLHAAEDRRAFRRWFTELADLSADKSPAQLPPEIIDCASFIRYAYREALRTHDDRWYAQFPAGMMPALPSVQQWSYPNTPLSSNLFRTRAGPFRPTDLSDGTFTQFADAKTLHYDNAYLVSRDLGSAKPGDLIFYRVLETDSQYHSMIITGERGEWVVYNTGPDHGHHGEMRRVLLADLLHHPDPQWRPEAANPNWLGVYRWNILRED